MCIQDVPDGNQAAETARQNELAAHNTLKGAVSASYLYTSDTSGVSRRTGFTCAIPSGVNSAPDSRETIMAHGCGAPDNGAAASNIDSFTRLNGSNGSNGSNGNGSSTADGIGPSTADGNGLASNEGNQGSAQGANGVSSAAPAACAGGVSKEDGSQPGVGKCQLSPLPQPAVS